MNLGQRPMSPCSFDIGRALNVLNKKITPLPLRTTSREILNLLVFEGMIWDRLFHQSFPFLLIKYHRTTGQNQSRWILWYKSVWPLFIGHMRGRNCLRRIYSIVILAWILHWQLFCVSVIILLKKGDNFSVFPWNNILKWSIFQRACLVLSEFITA